MLEVIVGFFVFVDWDVWVVFIIGYGDVGYLKVCNMGVKVVKGEYICILMLESILFWIVLKELVFEGLSLEKFWILGLKFVMLEGFEKVGYCREKLMFWWVVVDVLGFVCFSFYFLFCGFS